MNQKIIDILKTQLVGKKIKHKNQYYREVSLKVEDVLVERHHRQITADTRENDFYGESCDWDTIKLCFEDGSSTEVNLETKLEIEE